MDYQALKTLIQTHPSYPTVDDIALAEWCNEKVISQDVERLSAETVYEAIEPTDFAALSDSGRNEVWNILILHASGGVPTLPTARARKRLVSIFGAGSTTIATNLAPLTSTLVSRAAAVGILETVRPGDCEFARTV